MTRLFWLLLSLIAFAASWPVSAHVAKWLGWSGDAQFFVAVAAWFVLSSVAVSLVLLGQYTSRIVLRRIGIARGTRQVTRHTGGS